MKANFAQLTPDEHETVMMIANRAERLYFDAGQPRDRLSIYMDISAAHEACPLRLGELLDADDVNFAHDVGGIGRHLNRDTGQLLDCFVPRFARQS